jgi:signal transduction histidine kinase
VRRRLVLAIALVAMVSVALFALPLGVVLQRTYRDEELLRLQRDTVAATRQIDLTAAGADPLELPRSRDSLTVYDAAGRRVGGRGPARVGALVRRAIATGKPASGTQGGHLEAAVPLLTRERVTGAVLATRVATAVTARTERAWWRLVGLAAAILLLAVAAAALLGRRLAVPLERLASSARRLGEGDFAARAPRVGVAELDQVGAALDATAARLDDLVTSERAFSADASHQLRTPLAALRLELEALELRGEPSPELAAALREVDRLQATVETLLSVARDKPRGERDTDLAALVDEVGQRWRGPLAQMARPLRIAVPGEAPAAFAADGVVRQVLDVLLSNACKHGAGPVTMTVRDPGDGWLAIDVHDEGPGIPGDDEAVFRRHEGSGAGHGIGLALARSLAHAEGGRLSLAMSGPGPTFTLTLPAVPERARPS